MHDNCGEIARYRKSLRRDADEMPRPKKQPRLYLRKARSDRAAIWVILDGQREVRTGCSEFDVEGAETALSEYLASKWSASGNHTPAQLSIAEVLMAYAKEHAPHTARPDVIAYHIEALLPFWKGKNLTDVKSTTCREYSVYRVNTGVSLHTARHDLETLRSAINYYHREYQLNVVPVVTLPPKPDPKSRWLTRDEAAALIHAARASKRTHHVARLILIGIYSGTRPGAMLALKWIPSPTCGWIDVEGEVIHRKGHDERSTKKRRPPARIHDRLLPHLKRWRKADMDKGISTVCHYQGRQVKKLRNSWKTVCNLAKLEDVSPHTTRHTAATWQMQAGTTYWDAAGFLGMTVETLERVYGHHHAEFQKSAASAQAPKVHKL